MSANKLANLCNKTASKAWVRIYRELEAVEYALRFQSQTDIAKALDISRTTFQKSLKRARKEFKEYGAYSEFKCAHIEPKKPPKEVQKEVKQVQEKRSENNDSLPPPPGLLKKSDEEINFN